ncbi:hypothetical protein EN792_060175, partial [Mesorhizobium sp. M00.F.Ca.ET.149.01.1.1]
MLRPATFRSRRTSSADNHGGSSSANLTITITGTNDAPVAVADAAAVKED